MKASAGIALNLGVQAGCKVEVQGGCRVAQSRLYYFCQVFRN